MYKCPICGCKRFIADCTVRQTIMIDENADTISVEDDCAEILFMPSDVDIWECESCGYVDHGQSFKVDETAIW